MATAGVSAWLSRLQGHAQHRPHAPRGPGRTSDPPTTATLISAAETPSGS